MDLTFDESLFNKIIVVLVIAIVIVGAVAALRFSVFSVGGDVPAGRVPAAVGTLLADEPKEVVAGLRSYNWSCRGAGWR